MRIIIITTLFVLFIQSANALTSDEILSQAVSSMYPYSFIADEKMSVYKNNEFSNSYRLKVNIKNYQKGLVYFNEPATEKGKKILRIEQNMWMYFPSNQKAIRVSSKDRLMGGDFSFTDIIRVDLVHDYHSVLVGDKDIGGTDCYELELKAKDPTVAYDKVMYYVNKSTFNPVYAEYYTVSGKMLKSMTFKDPKVLGGILRPTVLQVDSVITKGNKTVIEILSIEPKEFSDNMFTLEYLKR